jgi:tRNA modification GTPase
MFSTDDTIVAIATPPGRGGIGVVRLSGPDALRIASVLTGRASFEPRYATLAIVSDPAGASIDQAVITAFPAPHSYTGDDVVELSSHGSPVVLRAIVGAALARGARLANPGEFTFRAYLNRRIDLVQAEAIGDLIDAVTPLQARIAFDQLDGTLTSRLRDLDAALLDVVAPLEASLDFPDEGYHFVARSEAAQAIGRALAAVDALLADARRGRMIRDGLTVAIVGRPNAGKSSLFNRLAGAARAIVTDVPGTTRDLLTERVDVHGVPLTIVDTAGLRTGAADAVEAEGISRARRAAEAADVTIAVFDRSRPLDEEDLSVLSATAARPRIVVASKCDLPAAWGSNALMERIRQGAQSREADAVRPAAGEAGSAVVLEVSALTDAGIASLRTALIQTADLDHWRDGAPVANQRHAALLAQAREALARAADGVATAIPEELVLADLHDARARFDDVVGARPQDEVLGVIFERFCIGK